MAHICTSSVSAAISENNIEKLCSLLEKRKRVDICDNLGYVSIHVAAKIHNLEIVNILVKHPDVDINCRTFEGFTPLYIACELNNTNLTLIEHFLCNGADANIGNNEDITPLHLACRKSDQALVKLLLKYGANINCQDFNCYTPLFYAIEQQSSELICFLLEQNADANLTDLHNLTPLMFSLKFSEKYADLFLSYTDINIKANDNKTALILSIEKKYFDLSKKLIERGALNFKNYWTYLFKAKSNNCFELFKLIWINIDFEKAFIGNYLFIKLCEVISISDDMQYLKLIFETKNINIYLKNKRGIGRMFNSEKFSDKETYIQVINWYKNANLNYSVYDLGTITAYFSDCVFRLEILKYFVETCLPDIHEHLIIFSLSSNDCETSLLYLQYCFHFNCDVIFDYFCNVYDTVKDISDFVIKFIKLFTPNNYFKEKLLLASNKYDDGKLCDVLQNKVKFPTLTELSRNTFRLLLKEKGENTVDYITYLNNLNIPVVLRDIIQLRNAVNINI